MKREGAGVQDRAGKRADGVSGMGGGCSLRWPEGWPETKATKTAGVAGNGAPGTNVVGYSNGK